MNGRSLSILLFASALAGAACTPDTAGVFTTSGGPGGTGPAGAAGTGPAGAAGSTGASGGTGGTGATGGTAMGGTSAGGTMTTGGSAGTGGSVTTGGSAGTGGTMPCMPGGPNDDQDGDGATPAQGDCDDCDMAVGPNSIEIVGNQVDDDCNGQVDEKPMTCDEPLAIDEPISGKVAWAVDLCKPSKGGKDWGVLGSLWVLPDGQAAPANDPDAANFHLGHGVLPDFGPNVLPRAGKKLLALSSGAARRPGDAGFANDENFSKGYACNAAQGFPKESCGAVSGAPNDGTGLAVSIQVPMNVHGFSYDFSFYARDFPGFVCSQYNDVFFAILNPPLMGQPDPNLAYDELGNPVTLNGANFHVCSCMNGPPCSNQGGQKQYDCALGAGQLMGTGFETHGATGWLTTTVPVEPGSAISIRWGAYDTGDGQFDSTVLLDNWQWITKPGVTLGTKIAQ